MRTYIHFTVLAAALVLNSCNNSDFTHEKLIVLDLENCKTSVNLKLGDLIDDIRFVRLETSDSAMLGNASFHIAGNYIFARDNDAILKFSSIDGSFIEQILKKGRGPGELPERFHWYFNEKSNFFFIDDYFLDLQYFKVYDYEKEVFLRPVKKYSEDRLTRMAFYDDSLILCSFLRRNRSEKPLACFIQDYNGKLVTGIPSTRLVKDGRSSLEYHQVMSMTAWDNGAYLKYQYEDTVYSFDIRTRKVYPFMVLNHKNSPVYPPSDEPEVGEKLTSLYFANDYFMTIGLTEYQGWSQITSTMTRRDQTTKSYIYDKATEKLAFVTSFTDELTRLEQSVGSITVLSDGTAFKVYNATDIINADAGAFDGFAGNISNQLNDLKKDLDEMDNPVLLIGKVKKLSGKLIP